MKELQLVRTIYFVSRQYMPPEGGESLETLKFRVKGFLEEGAR